MSIPISKYIYPFCLLSFFIFSCGVELRQARSYVQNVHCLTQSSKTLRSKRTLLDTVKQDVTFKTHIT